MSLAPVMRQRFFDSNGDPLSGGKLYTYEAGTTTPQASYTDSSLGTANANPVILDANGEADVWLDPSLSYKFTLTDSNDVEQFTTDNVIGLLTNNSVITASIQDGAVSTAKIADDAITADKLRDDVSTDVNRAVTTNHLRNESVTLAKLAPPVQQSLCPTGTVLSYVSATAPTGWLNCDGTAVSRTIYANLYAIIGDSFGEGDGSTTFHLPDLRGQFLRGHDGGAGVDPDAASRTALNTGGNTGDNIGSKQDDEFDSHNHGGGVHNHTYRISTAINAGSPSRGYERGNAVSGAPFPETDNSGTIINTQGGNETRSKNVAVNFIIKT